MRILLFLPFLVPSIVFGQTTMLDSLEAQFSAPKNDAQRLELLAQMTDAAYGIDIKIALGYAKRGVALAEQSSDKNWQPKFYEMQGRMHANLLQLDSAVLFFDKAMTGYAGIGNKKGQATTSFKIAWVHKKKGEIDKAMDADIQALRAMEALGDQEGIADALGRVSEDLTRQGQHTEAMEYAQKAIDICQKNGYQKQLANALTFAGDACISQGNPGRALEYYNQSFKLVQAQGFGAAALADNLNNRGNALKRLGHYDAALDAYKECRVNAEKANYSNAINATTANLADIYLLQGNYAAALPFQLKTIRLQEESRDLSNLVEAYNHASIIYENMGNYSQALQYERKARRMRDSTASLQSDAAISELRTQYETEKNEATISAQEQQIAQQKMVQWLGFGLAALLAFMALNFYRNAQSRKKTNALLAAENAQNELLLKEIHHRVKNNLEVVSSLLALQSAQIDD